MRVLVVDDNVDSAEMLSVLFTLTGHDCRLVHSGNDAVIGALDFAPQVALIDILLPDISGVVVATHLRGLFGKSIRLVAHTGLAMADTFSRDGFDAVLIKPCSIRTLLAQVQR